MNVWLSLFFVALGMGISEAYNFIMWRRYMQGMEHGVSMRSWKEGTDARPALRVRTRSGK